MTPEAKEPRRNVSKLSFNDADDKLSVHSSFEVIPKAKDHGGEKKQNNQITSLSQLKKLKNFEEPKSPGM